MSRTKLHTAAGSSTDATGDASTSERVSTTSPATAEAHTSADQRAALRRHIGTWGAWSFGFAYAPSDQARAAAAAIEAAGYGCVWYPETLDSREAFVNAAVLLGATERILIASGIANVWARDAIAAASASRTLNDSFDGRFLLGLGVSHPPQVDPRGTTTYLKPVAKMREYLGQIERGAFDSPDGEESDEPPVQTIKIGRAHV